MSGTHGIVHASAESYRSFTFDELMNGANATIPNEIRKMIPPFKFVSPSRPMISVSNDRLIFEQVQDVNAEECWVAKLLKVATRDWRISNKASAPFKSVEGPLSIKTDDHDIMSHIGEMLTRIAISVKNRKEEEKRRRQ